MMPHILGLPNELLFRTLRYVKLGDVFAFASTCRLFRAVSKTKIEGESRLEEYQRVKKEWRCQDVNSEEELQDLVRKAVLEDYGSFVQELRFNNNYGFSMGSAKPCRDDSLYQRALMAFSIWTQASR
jgi:hypothetical protein